MLATTLAEIATRAERGRRVREILRRDPLTGALHHSALSAELDHEVARSARRGDVSVRVAERARRAHWF